MRACFLGVTFGIGLIISCSDTTWTHFGWYVALLLFILTAESVLVVEHAEMKVLLLQVHVLPVVLPLL